MSDHILAVFKTRTTSEVMEAVGQDLLMKLQSTANPVIASNAGYEVIRIQDSDKIAGVTVKSSLTILDIAVVAINQLRNNEVFFQAKHPHKFVQDANLLVHYVFTYLRYGRGVVAQHEQWVAHQIATGWSQGSKYNEELKQDPDLRQWDALAAKQKFVYLTVSQIAESLRMFLSVPSSVEQIVKLWDQNQSWVDLPYSQIQYGAVFKIPQAYGEQVFLATSRSYVSPDLEAPARWLVDTQYLEQVTSTEDGIPFQFKVTEPVTNSETENELFAAEVSEDLDTTEEPLIQQEARYDGPEGEAEPRVLAVDVGFEPEHYPQDSQPQHEIEEDLDDEPAEVHAEVPDPAGINDSHQLNEDGL